MRPIRRRAIEVSSVPKMEPTWTDEDVRRLRSLKLTICRQVKPDETIRLYAITQRLSAMRMRLDGSVVGHEFQKEIESIPNLSAEQCQFLYDVLHRVLNGERDAFKAFQLALADANPPNPKTPFMAAEYELGRRILPKALNKALRFDIADKYKVTPSRVSQAHSKHRKEIDAWLGEALDLADAERIPRELMVRHLSALVQGQAAWFIGSSKGVTLNDTPPEHLFNVEFPILLVNRTQDG
jgi:hypothetical protein